MDVLATIATALWVIVTVGAAVSAAWLITTVRSDPRVTLGERLARGEIGVDEYRRAIASLA